MEDSDSEYEIEEAVVLVELNGIIDSNFLLQEQLPSRILGIDSDKPILQLGQYAFSGEYEDTLGTVVVYEVDESPNNDVDVAEDKYKFVCKTDKKLSMKRVFIQEKREDKIRNDEFAVDSSIATESFEIPLKQTTPPKNIHKKSLTNTKKSEIDNEIRNMSGTINQNQDDLKRNEHLTIDISKSEAISPVIPLKEESLTVNKSSVNSDMVKNNSEDSGTMDNKDESLASNTILNVSQPINNCILDVINEIVDKTTFDTRELNSSEINLNPSTSTDLIQSDKYKSKKQKRKYDVEDEINSDCSSTKKIVLSGDNIVTMMEWEHLTSGSSEIISDTNKYQDTAMEINAEESNEYSNTIPSAIFESSALLENKVGKEDLFPILNEKIETLFAVIKPDQLENTTNEDSLLPQNIRHEDFSHSENIRDDDSSHLDNIKDGDSLHPENIRDEVSSPPESIGDECSSHPENIRENVSSYLESIGKKDSLHSKNIRDVDPSHSKNITDEDSSQLNISKDGDSSHPESFRYEGSSHPENIREDVSSYPECIRDVDPSHSKNITDEDSSQLSNISKDGDSSHSESFRDEVSSHSANIRDEGFSHPENIREDVSSYPESIGKEDSLHSENIRDADPSHSKNITDEDSSQLNNISKDRDSSHPGSFRGEVSSHTENIRDEGSSHPENIREDVSSYPESIGKKDSLHSENIRDADLRHSINITDEDSLQLNNISKDGDSSLPEIFKGEVSSQSENIRDEGSSHSENIGEDVSSYPESIGKEDSLHSGNIRDVDPSHSKNIIDEDSLQLSNIGKDGDSLYPENIRVEVSLCPKNIGDLALRHPESIGNMDSFHSENIGDTDPSHSENITGEDSSQLNNISKVGDFSYPENIRDEVSSHPEIIGNKDSLHSENIRDADPSHSKNITNEDSLQLNNIIKIDDSSHLENITDEVSSHLESIRDEVSSHLESIRDESSSHAINIVNKDSCKLENIRDCDSSLIENEDSSHIEIMENKDSPHIINIIDENSSHEENVKIDNSSHPENIRLDFSHSVNFGAISFQAAANLGDEESFYPINNPHHSIEVSSHEEYIDHIPQPKIRTYDLSSYPGIISDEDSSSIESPHQLVESSTDKNNDSVICESTNIKNDCSSSADTNDFKLSDIGACQSSDGKSILASFSEQSKHDKATSSTNRQHEKLLSVQSTHNRLQEDQEMSPINIKDGLCEVSQSSRDCSDITFQSVVTQRDFNECEAQQLSNNSSSEFAENWSDSQNNEEVHTQDQVISNNQLEETNEASHSRKLSSCEVTQSCSSKDEDNANECDVFLQNIIPGIKNMHDPTSSRIDPLLSADEDLREVDFMRQSVASEGSISEITQSHRAEIYSISGGDELTESVICDTDVGVCSQSSSYISTVPHPSESKDLCVSSCDTHEDAISIVLDSGVRSSTCEVSQSDKPENRNFNEVIHAQDNDQMVSSDISSPEAQEETSDSMNNSKDNFCEVTESYKSEKLNQRIKFSSKDINFSTENNSSECEALVVPMKCPTSETVSADPGQPCASSSYVDNGVRDIFDTDVENISCEVTQSSPTEKISVANAGLSLTKKLHSSECEVYEENDFISEDSELTSRSLYGSSGDRNLVSSVILLDAGEEGSMNPPCEVSQSFRSAEENNLPFEECCVSSDERNDFSIHYSVAESEDKVTDEVSQSDVEALQPGIENYDLSECDQPGMISHSIESVNESNKDVCSSDEVHAIAEISTNSVETNTNNTVCEVTQSDRPEEEISVLHEDEVINECDVYEKSPTLLEEQGIDLRLSSRMPSNICESSDDVDYISSESLNFSSKQFEIESLSTDICQSSRFDENISQLSELPDESERNDTGCETEVKSAAASLICESSADVKIDDAFDQKSILDPCTSSDKTEGETIHNLHSDYRLCDSISNQEVLSDSSDFASSETESTQLGRDLTNNSVLIDPSLAIPLPPHSMITVSSSVDITSNPIGVIYSSHVSHFPSQHESMLSSNSEVSQSMTKTNDQITEGILDSNEAENNTSYADSAMNHPSVIVSVDSNVTSNTLENNELMLDNKFEPTQNFNNPPSLKNIENVVNIESSNNTRVESSSPDINEIEQKKSSLSSKLMKNSEVVKKVGRRMKFTPKLITKTKGATKPVTSDPEEAGCSSQHVEQSTNQETQSLVIPSTSLGVIRSNTDSRPSLLEVIVSSASDFRNSLIHDSNNFDKEINVSSPTGIAESSSHNESAESLISNRRYGEDSNEHSKFYVLTDGSFVNENIQLANSDISESVKYDRNNDNSDNQHLVTQSSEIANIYSSTSGSEILDSENVSESSQLELVQSTSGVSKISSASNNSYISEHVSSADELVSSFPKFSCNSEVSESCSAKFVPGSNSESYNSENFVQYIESSDDVNSYPEESSLDEPDNTESKVTSTPFETIVSNVEAHSADGSGQCALIEGTDETQNRQGNDVCHILTTSNAELTSNPNLNSTSESNVSASHDNRPYPSKSWSMHSDEDNPCESSSVDEKNSSCDSPISESLFITSEVSNEAEVLKSSYVDDNVNNDCQNISQVSESGIIVCIPPIVTNEPVSQTGEVMAEYETNYTQEISQSSIMEHALRPESYIKTSASCSREFTTGEISQTDEIESSNKSVVSNENLAQDMSLSEEDSIIHSQSGEFSNGNYVHSSSSVTINEPVITLGITNRIQTSSNTISPETSSAANERRNVSQSHSELFETVEDNETPDK